MKTDIAKVLRLWESRLLILLIYTLPLIEAPKNVLWGILVAAWIARCIAERRMPCVGRVGWFVLAWLLAGIWSSCFAIEPYKSWEGVWDMARGGMFLWIVGSQALDERARLGLLRHMVISAAIASGVGLYDFALRAIHTRPLNEIWYRHIQLRSVGHFNQSGIYLAMATLLAVVSTLDARAFVRPWAGRICVIVIGLALLGTTARTAIVVVALVGCWILWCNKPPRWMIWVLAGGVALALTAIAGSSVVRGRVFFRGSYNSRVGMWQAAVDMAEKRPWTGVGLKNFKNLHLRGDTLEVFSIDHAHNVFFTALGQMGFPGAIALVGMVAALGGMVWRSRACGDRLWFYAGAGVWLVIVLVGMSNTTLHDEMSMLFFIVMGLVCGTKSAGMTA